MLEVRELRFVYRSLNGQGAVEAIGGVSFTVREREFVSIVGPSGCGKTTLLTCVMGLQRPSSGEVRLNGQLVTGPPEDMLMVFQEYQRSLLPWRTVRGNVLFGLESKRGLAPRQRREMADAALAQVGLLDFGDYYPAQLSGGMQQRVAIARAVACRPRILLMDEPFGSLDAQTRLIMEDELLNLAARTQMTILFVTHDIDEAVYLSDRVLVLSKRPARILEEIVIDLPRPRSQLESRGAKFAEYRARVYQTLKTQWSEVS